MSDKAFPAVGIDIGSSRTRLVVCLVEDERLRFLGHGECESRGWVKRKLASRPATDAGEERSSRLSADDCSSRTQ